MTRKECLKILKDKGHQEYKELHHTYYTNYNKAKKFFKPLIDDMRRERPSVDIVLHHIEWNDQNYELWDTVVPLYNDEHAQIHSHNRKHTEETKKKLSERKIGKNNPMYGRTGENSPFYGKKHSDERRQRNSEAQKGKKCPSVSESNKKRAGVKRSTETRERMSIAQTGKSRPWASERNKQSAGTSWYNNGIKNIQAFECPAGFSLGMIKRKTA